MGRKQHLAKLADDELIVYEQYILRERVSILTEKALRSQLSENRIRRLKVVAPTGPVIADPLASPFPRGEQVGSSFRDKR